MLICPVFVIFLFESCETAEIDRSVRQWRQRSVGGALLCRTTPCCLFRSRMSCCSISASEAEIWALICPSWMFDMSTAQMVETSQTDKTTKHWKIHSCLKRVKDMKWLLLQIQFNVVLLNVKMLSYVDAVNQERQTYSSSVYGSNNLNIQSLNLFMFGCRIRLFVIFSLNQTISTENDSNLKIK